MQPFRLSGVKVGKPDAYRVNELGYSSVPFSEATHTCGQANFLCSEGRREEESVGRSQMAQKEDGDREKRW